MKIKFWSFLLLIVGLLLFVPLTIAQTNFRTEDTTILRSDEIINSDYFATGETVTLAGTVEGDAYLAGGNINVTGTVNGDVLAAGGNINISGTVNGNIRTAGGNITISGSTGRNITAVGGTIMLANTAETDGSAVVAGGDINLLGPVGRGVTIGAGQVTLANQIEGNVNIGTGQLSLAPQAKINGDLIYWSENSADISSEASVSGTVTQNIPPKTDKDVAEAGKAAAAGVFTFFKILSFITALVVGMLFLWLVPNYVKATTEVITQNPLLSFGIGFLALAVTPLLVIILLVTMVGIPFAVIWLFFLILDMWLAKIFISLVIGVWTAKFFNKKTSIYLAFLSGLVIFYLVTIIPIVGWIIALVSSFIGLGAMIITKKNYYQDLRKKAII